MKVEFQGQLSPFSKCISMCADGEAEIKFTTDATQLANIIRALANFPKGKLIKITLEPVDRLLTGGKKNGNSKKQSKIIR